MPSKFDQGMLASLNAAQAAYLALLNDGSATEKQAFGRSWKKSDVNELYEQIVKLEKQCEARGLVSVNLRSSKIGVAQMQEFNPTGWMR